MWRWHDMSSIYILLPFPNVTVIYPGCRWSPRVHDQVHCLLGHSGLLVDLPQILQTSRLRRLCWIRGWTASGWLGRCRRRGLHWSRMGGVSNSRCRAGYHTCVGQSGTTSTPMALSCLTFRRTCVTTLNGGNMYTVIFFQERLKASTAKASGSGR